ncbi:MAG TPA: hypothetical protein VJG32_08975 [Anaerolineae bacterium]|nr:hypothetical protein [Anaerolineae bacterium]
MPHFEMPARARVAHLARFKTANKFQWIVIWCVLTALFAIVATIIPASGVLAFDWIAFFDQGWNVPAFYPPWTRLIVLPLSWPLLTGLTLSTFSVAVLQRASSLPSTVAAFLNLPLFWTIFLGQLDGLALLGVIGLPWLAPLALTKPQVASFAIASQRTAIILTAIFLVISFLLWGFWPADMLTYHSNREEWPQDIALGWLIGIPLFALLVWKMPKKDADWWMLAGTTLTPFLIPYNLLPLMPAIARLPRGWAIAAAIASWLPLSANWIGPFGWRLGWLSIAIIGIGLVVSRRDVLLGQQPVTA